MSTLAQVPEMEAEVQVEAVEAAVAPQWKTGSVPLMITGPPRVDMGRMRRGGRVAPPPCSTKVGRVTRVRQDAPPSAEYTTVETGVVTPSVNPATCTVPESTMAMDWGKAGMQPTAIQLADRVGSSDPAP